MPTSNFINLTRSRQNISSSSGVMKFGIIQLIIDRRNAVLEIGDRCRRAGALYARLGRQIAQIVLQLGATRSSASARVFSLTASLHW